MHRLHPDLAALLREQGWDGLTPAQDAAMGPLARGDHGLLVAPTGHGKTEAALLPTIDRLLRARDDLAQRGKPWPAGFKALYITPLRALNRDLLGRLETWGDALNLKIGVRHGDTKQSERARQSRNPPDLLITTPETVQLLLYGDTLRRHLRTVRFVILDEVHDLCTSERGAQLSVALERIEEVVAQPEELLGPAKHRPCPKQTSATSGFQRIGLSATVADAGAVAAWLGGPTRDVETIRVDAAKEIRLRVGFPAVDERAKADAVELAVPPAVAAELDAVRDIVAGHERTLVFHNTRDGAELLASRSALLDDNGFGLHHGSLSAEHRADVEDRFKSGDLHALVATSSLELGIDVGAIDHVVQIHSPRSVARMLQRLGRAGHRLGAVSEGTLIGAGPEDVLECIAVARMAQAGRLEQLRIRESPLVVLANQLVALSQEYTGLQADWCRMVFARSGAFADLDDGLFEATWQALLDVKTLFEDEERGGIARSGRGRRHFLDHIGLIPDERTYRVLDEATKRTVGTVDDAFVAAGLHPGASFVMAGRGWNVLEIDTEEARVRVAPAKDLGPVPDWTGSMLPVSFSVAQAAARLRGELADGAEPTEADTEAVDAAAEPVREQQRAGLRVPTDRCVTVEASGREVVVLVALGTRGNEALGRITQALMHQRLGAAVGMTSDAYRIRFTFPERMHLGELDDMWSSLDPDTLDLLVAMVLKDAPSLKHHLVHIAKHFGALPKDLDPNRFSRAKLDALLGHVALQEESMARLVHDRLDLDAVAAFVQGLHDGSWTLHHQGLGPIARLGQTDARRMLQATDDDALLAKVQERIEGSDVLMVCTQCRNALQSQVHLLAPKIHCRRCGSNQVACMRPWHDDKLRLLGKGTLAPEERKEADRIRRNAALVAGHGATACRALVGRGVGPTAAARILQKTRGPNDRAFWREILNEELQFARTNAYWNK